MDSRKAADDKRLAAARPSRRWYNSMRWKRMRAAQLKREALCRKCRAQGMSRIATTADHIVPHRDDPKLFWGGELQSLCDTCHSSAKQREEREGFARELGDDGWPVDPRHPFNVNSAASDMRDAVSMERKPGRGPAEKRRPSRGPGPPDGK